MLCAYFYRIDLIENLPQVRCTPITVKDLAMRSAPGFSLIELIICIAVAAVISSVATPNFLAWMDSRKLVGATADIWGLLQQARIAAAKEHANVVLTFDPDTDGILDGRYMVFVDNGSNPKTRWSREPDERILNRSSLPPGVRFHEVSFAGGIPRTRFNSRGFPNGLGGHVYLCNRRKQYMGVHLNLNGSVRIVRSESGEKGTWE
jgi:prepilin-type N-terminal cleavage/methylation domain-containing protein